METSASKAPLNFNDRNMPGVRTVRLYGLDLWDTDLSTCARLLVAGISDSRSRSVFFINAHCVNVAATDPEYHAAVLSADVLLPDGTGMEMSARLAGAAHLSNLNGTDLFPLILAEAERTGCRVGLIGARPGIAELCKEKIRIRFPKLKVEFTADGYRSPESFKRIIKKSTPDIVFVAMGVPLQELTISRYKDSLGVPLIFGVGALFDFCSEAFPRAPRFIRTLRLEWAFRFLLEPVRLWRRYIIGNGIFLLRMAALRFRGKRALTEQIHLTGSSPELDI